MSDIKELNDEELEKVTGGENITGQPKYAKDESVFFTFFDYVNADMGHVDIVANGTIVEVHDKPDGYYYDIHHGCLSLIRRISNGTVRNGIFPERVETNIPENKINHTGIF